MFIYIYVIDYLSNLLSSVDDLLFNYHHVIIASKNNVTGKQTIWS